MEYTVYRLENVVTKKNYIGMTSRKPKVRWCSGYRGKMKEAIDAFPLDLCWKKHIEFQTPNKEQALELEAELMKYYDSVENGYNISSYGSGDFKRSEELKRKLSESLTGRTLTDEHKKKLSESHTGKHHTEETRKKLSESHTGKHNSEETNKKISQSKGVNGVLQYSKNGIFIAEYPSTQEASRKTGCNQGHICQCCKGKRKSCGGFIWKYKEG